MHGSCIGGGDGTGSFSSVGELAKSTTDGTHSHSRNKMRDCGSLCVFQSLVKGRCNNPLSDHCCTMPFRGQPGEEVPRE